MPKGVWGTPSCQKRARILVPLWMMLITLLMPERAHGLHGTQTIPKSTCMAQSHTSRNNEIVNEWKPCPDALYLKEGGTGCRDFPVGVSEVGNCCCPGDYSCDFNDCYQFKGHSDIDWFCDCSEKSELVYTLTPEATVMTCGSCQPRCKQLSLVVEVETKQKALTGSYKACVEGNPNLVAEEGAAMYGVRVLSSLLSGGSSTTASNGNTSAGTRGSVVSLGALVVAAAVSLATSMPFYESDSLQHTAEAAWEKKPG